MYEGPPLVAAATHDNAPLAQSRGGHLVEGEIEAHARRHAEHGRRAADNRLEVVMVQRQQDFLRLAFGPSENGNGIGGTGLVE